MGITPATKPIQIESIDEELRIGLWNIYWLDILEKIPSDQDCLIEDELDNFFYFSFYIDYFKETLDTMPMSYRYAKSKFRGYFFHCDWFELYNFIEFTFKLITDESFKPIFDHCTLIKKFNRIFEREFAGYRIIEGIIAPITNPTEIDEIEESLSTTENFTSLYVCNIHLKEALSKLSDKLNPDYRNSIKESISAVESLAKIISNDSNNTLAAALDRIKGRLKIHPSLELGFKKIYGYTSDAGGIRHALTEEPTCDFEDAKFMLVSCSAFINYLIMKAKKTGVSF
jgi:hypothetical protein